METYQVYKHYGIRYYQLGGTTVVESGGFEIARFQMIGESKGLEKAKEFIDKRVDFAGKIFK